MREEIKKFHNHVLSLYGSMMFNNLVYPHNLVTDTPKEFIMLDDKNDEWKSRGYIAIKEVEGRKLKYFLQEKLRDCMPLRVENTKEFFLQDSTKVKSIINVVLEPTPFKIVSLNVFPDTHKFIDELCPFKHSNPDMFTLVKIIALMGYIGKPLTCICGPSEFGKTTIFLFIDAITQKSPVSKPRRPAGVLIPITEDGNYVADESQHMESETKQILEDLAMQIGDDRPIYHNGAYKTKLSKQNYNISQQAMTFLYNPIEHYPDQSKFFENMWDNALGMDSRYLKLKVDGILQEQFDKEFNMVHEATINKDYYIKVAKQLLYLKELRLNNGYKRRYITHPSLNHTGRKKDTFNEITWLLDMYSNSQAEYDKYITLLERAIVDYKAMLGHTVHYSPQHRLDKIKPGIAPLATEIAITEEVIEDSMPFDGKLLVWQKCVEDCTEVECNIGSDNRPRCKKHWRG